MSQYVRLVRSWSIPVERARSTSRHRRLANGMALGLVTATSGVALWDLLLLLSRSHGMPG